MKSNTIPEIDDLRLAIGEAKTLPQVKRVLTRMLNMLESSDLKLVDTRPTNTGECHVKRESQIQGH